MFLITLVDFVSFSLLIRRMKRNGSLSNRSLREFLVPALTHLDLWSVFVNEATLRLLGKQCPNLQQLILRDCGYVVTDHLLGQITKQLMKLHSLNLTGCHHVTDLGLKGIVHKLIRCQFPKNQSYCKLLCKVLLAYLFVNGQKQLQTTATSYDT